MSKLRIYHRLGTRQLRDWIHVEIEDLPESKNVTFVSRWHVGRRYPTSWCYTKDFTDEEILRDGKLANTCIAMFGRDVFVGSISI